MVDQLKPILFQGVSPIRLDSFRRCLALAFGFYMLYLFGNAGEWLTDAGYHVTAETQLSHSAQPWPTMDSWLVPAFGVVLFSAVICLVTGYYVRPATWIALACAIYVHRVDSLSAFALNKLFIVGFAVLALAPPPRKVKLNGHTEILQSVWPVRVLQATLIIIYFTSGISKGWHGDWLSDPDVVWTIVQGVFRTELSSLMLRTMPKSVFTLSMYLVFAFEILAPVIFIVPKLRPIAVVSGIIFHLSLAAMMSTVIFFSVTMISFYPLFLSEETLLRIRKWLTPPKLRTPQRRELESILGNESTDDTEKVAELRELLS